MLNARTYDNSRLGHWVKLGLRGKASTEFYMTMACEFHQRMPNDMLQAVADKHVPESIRAFVEIGHG